MSAQDAGEGVGAWQVHVDKDSVEPASLTQSRLQSSIVSVQRSRLYRSFIPKHQAPQLRSWHLT